MFSPAVVGMIGAAGILTALVPGSLISMTAAMLLAKNLIGLARPQATDDQTVALRQVACARRDAGRRLFHFNRERDDRGDASRGLQLRHSALSSRHREPDAAQSGDPGGRLRRIWSARRSPRSSPSLTRPSARCSPPCRKRSATSTSASSRLPRISSRWSSSAQ